MTELAIYFKKDQPIFYSGTFHVSSNPSQNSIIINTIEHSAYLNLDKIDHFETDSLTLKRVLNEIKLDVKHIE